MIALDGTPVTSGPQFDGLFTAHTGSTFTFTIVRAHTHVTNTVRVSFGRASAIVAPKNDAITYFLNGKTDGANGRFSDAVADFSKAIQLAPDFDLAYIGRGAARSAIETSVETNNDFIKATELDPEQAEGLRDIVTGVPIPLTDEPGGVIDTIKRAIKSDECTALAGTQNSDCGRDYALLVFADYLAGKYDDGIATAPTAESFAIGDTVTNTISLISTSSAAMPRAQRKRSNYFVGMPTPPLIAMMPSRFRRVSTTS
jgi:tetratricopeptide (TPR) repeat protein